MFRAINQPIKVSINSLLSNKGKSFLTMLGIVIGIASVILIMSIGGGAQSLILSQIKDLGTNLVGVIPGHTEEGEYPPSLMGIIITTLTYEDAMSLRDKTNVPNIVDVVAYSKGFGTVAWRSNSYDTNLSGSTAGYPEVENGEVAVGRFFTEEEERNLSRVVVLGNLVKEELFGESDAVGQRVKINEKTFEVIGVMKERGSVALQDYDDQVFIPIKSMQRLIAGVNHVGLLRAKIDHEDNIPKAINDITAVLRERHDIRDSSGKSDDFTVRSATEMLDMVMVVTDGLKYFLAAVAALSLVVGGIGIMNIMLMSVTARTREIGLRKALGANNFDITSQFLIESATITFISGILGITIGIVISYLVSVGVNLAGYSWDFVIPFYAIFLALGVATLVGFIFGLYPAKKASKLDPIEALRYE